MGILTAATYLFVVVVGSAEASTGLRGSEVGEVHNETLGALVSGSVAFPSQDRWMWDFCSTKCQAAGYCCNDARIGSNQMISCAQACLMRARGSTREELASTEDGHCKRNGGSGCSLSVRGHSYSFCSKCKDLTWNSKCSHGVPSPSACDYGASLVPTPDEYCSFRCKEAGYCCNDYKVGSNQMISCAQACMMRTLGTTWTQMASEKSGLCRRDGGSGCELTVGGRSYPFCSSCQDLTASPSCRHGVASQGACDFGASLPPSSWGEIR